MIKILTETFFHPGIFLVLAYLASYLFQGVARKTFILLAPLVSALMLLLTVNHEAAEFYISLVFLIILFFGCLFAYTSKKNDKENAQLALLYFGAAIPITMTSNLFLIFIFFEIMLVAATFMIFNGANRLSATAGINYFKFHILAGTLFLIGTITYYSEYGSWSILQHNFLDFSSHTKQLINVTILVSLLINIAAPPFSYWLIEGYAATTPTGSVFLSVVTTKIGLFLVSKLFLGLECLVYLGIFMGAYGVIYAALESNIRRIMNFSIISQLGVILMAIGAGGKDGLQAALFMIVSESVYIALAMMCAAALFLASKSKRYFQIGDCSRNVILLVCSALGLASISSFPFTPGYVGKYLLYNTEYVLTHTGLNYVITAITAGIAFAVGFKVFMFVFVYRFRNLDKEKPSVVSVINSRKIPLLSMAIVTLFLGLFPETILNVNISWFDEIFFNQVSMFLGVFCGFLLLGKLLIVTKKYTLLEFEWFYRYLFMQLYSACKRVIEDLNHKISEKLPLYMQNLVSTLGIYFGENGRLVSIKSQKNATLIIIFVLIALVMST